MRRYGLMLLLFAAVACKTSHQKWQDSLVAYREIKDKGIELELTIRYGFSRQKYGWKTCHQTVDITLITIWTAVFL
jgi:hypothetical protein